MNKYVFYLASFLVFINCKKTLSEGKNYTIETLMSNNRSSGGYFSKDASKLVYSSEETGVFNIYEVDLTKKKKSRKPILKRSPILFKDIHLLQMKLFIVLTKEEMKTRIYTL